MESPQPALGGARKLWLLWLTAGALSAFFAEATCGSMPLVLVSPMGLLLTFPLYALHFLTLGGWALRRSRNSLLTLYLAGTVFGLYEAYITKVLWHPPWNDHAWRIGGVAVIETVMLTWFWHPIMAFVVPALAAERWLTGSRTLYDQLPERIRRVLEKPRSPVWLGVALGLISGPLCKSPRIGIPAALGSALVLTCLATLWNRRAGRPARELSDLMPQGVPFAILTVLTLLLYPVLGRGIRPELLPGNRSQATIWLLYLCYGCLMFRSMRSEPVRESPPPGNVGEPAIPTRLRTFILAAVIAWIVACTAMLWLMLPAFLIIWGVGLTCGILFFVRSARAAAAGTDVRAGEAS